MTSKTQDQARFNSDWYKQPGVIYFMAAGSPPVAIKIGVTQRDRLDDRRRAIQSANHERIELLGEILFESGERPLLCAELYERKIHKKFEHLQRCKDGTVGHEWFDAAQELLDFIDAKAIRARKESRSAARRSG